MFSFNTQRHAFHLVDPSILPLLTSIGALSLTLGSVLFFHGYSGGLEMTFFGLLPYIIGGSATVRAYADEKMND